MARISILDTIDEAIRTEFDDRLRKANYGQSIEITAWLRSRGVDTTKSSVNRYSRRLKAKDNATKQILISIDTGEAMEKDATGLLMELGALKVKETIIIDRLKDMGITGSQNKEI